jgi:hypothetical protein
MALQRRTRKNIKNKRVSKKYTQKAGKGWRGLRFWKRKRGEQRLSASSSKVGGPVSSEGRYDSLAKGSPRHTISAQPGYAGLHRTNSVGVEQPYNEPLAANLQPRPLPQRPGSVAVEQPYNQPLAENLKPRPLPQRPGPYESIYVEPSNIGRNVSNPFTETKPGIYVVNISNSSSIIAEPTNEPSNLQLIQALESILTYLGNKHCIYILHKGGAKIKVSEMVEYVIKSGVNLSQMDRKNIITHESTPQNLPFIFKDKKNNIFAYKKNESGNLAKFDKPEHQIQKYKQYILILNCNTATNSGVASERVYGVPSSKPVGSLPPELPPRNGSPPLPPKRRQGQSIAGGGRKTKKANKSKGRKTKRPSKTRKTRSHKRK